MKKPAIPAVPRADPERTRFDAAIKERLEIMGGDRTGKLAALPGDASLADVIARINEIGGRLQ